MSEELYILGGISICILLVFLMLRKRKKAKAAQNEAVVVRQNDAPKAPPPLPTRRAQSLPPRYPNLRALDYPKCPLDRSRNEPGKPQVIFWNSTKRCYTCRYGHQFTGKE